MPYYRLTVYEESRPAHQHGFAAPHDRAARERARALLRRHPEATHGDLDRQESTPLGRVYPVLHPDSPVR